MPNHLVREWLARVVGKVIVDMEKNVIEIHVQLPTEMLESAFSNEKAMRLVTTSASPSSYQRHHVPALNLGISDCEYK